MYLIGYDIGSSSIKAGLIEAETGETKGVVQYPDREMPIAAPHPGWAEQDPELWWQYVGKATRKLLAKTRIDASSVRAVGIAYQMHGLVLVDKDHQVLRPSIIWCDSRAVPVGQAAFRRLGEQQALAHLLNSPGNFTASKLRWVQENEPALYDRIHAFMLPGDYIAMKLTGEPSTTISGLSEGVFWDFRRGAVADMVLEDFQIARDLIPRIVPTFSVQGELSRSASAATGLPRGIPVSYRAGDQPNNALSLNVLEPGEVAGTGGTSGVVYAVTDEPRYDPKSRVNGFAHVNYKPEAPRIGVLMCVNGAGILYSWMKHQIVPEDLSYGDMEKMAGAVPVGAEGLTLLPFGNGAERILENRNLQAHLAHLDLNRHGKAHLLRAGLEGIAFAFVYGIEIMQGMGLSMEVMRVGNDNLFQSALFAHTISTLTNSRIEMMQTTGAIGAARGAGVGAGIYRSLKVAMRNMKSLHTYEPHEDPGPYREAYQRWSRQLHEKLQRHPVSLHS